jgi:hypothetical protein
MVIYILHCHPFYWSFDGLAIYEIKVRPNIYLCLLPILTVYLSLSSTVCLFVCPSECLTLCPTVNCPSVSFIFLSSNYKSAHLSVCSFVSLSICHSVHLTVRASTVCLSICFSVHLYVVSVFKSICMSVSLSVHLSICPYLSLFICPCMS